MRAIIFVFVFVCFINSLLIGANLQKIETSMESGSKIISGVGEIQNTEPASAEITSRENRFGTIWNYQDPASICEEVHISTVSQNAFIKWELNNERVELFSDTNIPLWSYAINNNDFGFPSDMTDDGTTLAVGDLFTLKLFDPESAIPTWEFNMSRNIMGIALSLAGNIVYTVSYDSGADLTYVECYTVGNTTPIWTTNFTGNTQTFTSSGDCSRLILAQRGSIYKMWIINSADGSVLADLPYDNQNPPAMSDNGNVIVTGSYSGYVNTYIWNEELLTYDEQWSVHVGNGIATWVGGLSVSGDGSTIAAGTLIFLTAGYDGEIFLFNIDSPTPLWIYENAGDFVADLDMNLDGSLLAAGSYGAMDHSTPDFMLFRRESNIPVFEINTPGSFFSVDIAEDGSSCIVGGKAVHAREMGSGGLIYYIDCNLGGGSITGIVNLDGSEDNSGVKVEVNGLDNYYGISDVNGAFLIENVPAGIYVLDYIKIGYMFATQVVEVLEGETVCVDDLTIYSWGAPPENLTASQSAGLTVELNWDAPASGDIDGYHIYRKNFSVDSYPLEPLATVEADQTSYNDDTAFPCVEYYYTVTGQVLTDFQTPFSNEAMGWIATGFVAAGIDVYVGDTPVIDGVISPGEWDDAFMVDSSDFLGTYDGTPQDIGSVIGYYKTNTAITELYVAYINYNDNQLEDHDEVALYIDDNNDGTFPEPGVDSEGNYWAAYYAAGNQLKYRPIYSTGGVGAVQYLDNPQLEVSVDTGYLVYEFMIPIGTEPWKINPSDDLKSSMGLFVLDDNYPDPNGFDGWWPMGNTNLFSPNNFGTVSYGITPQTPPAPTNLNFSVIETLPITLHLFWDMSDINDFSHFNIYCAINNGTVELIGTSPGTVFDYQLPDVPDSEYSLYVTTVNQTDMESDPSNTVEYTPASSGNISPALSTHLGGNYPNPFNPTTTIYYNLKNEGNVELMIYNIRGQLVRTLVSEHQTTGEYTTTWNGRDDSAKISASGIYFYKMRTSNYEKTRKMILLK